MVDNFDDEMTLEDQGDFFHKKFLNSSEDNGNTPDLIELMQRGSQLLFVAGSLKRVGFAYDYYLKHAAFVGTGFTSNPYFSMYEYQLNYPLIFQENAGDHATKKSRVYGDVFLVTSTQMAKIDYFEERGENTYRTKIEIEIPKPFKLKKGIRLFCHTHLCKKPDWKDYIDNHELKLVPIYNKKQNKSFQFFNWKPTGGEVEYTVEI